MPYGQALLIGLGGGFVGAITATYLVSASVRRQSQRMTDVLEESLTSTLRSDNARLASARRPWHHYFLTTLRGQYVWRYEQYPFHLSAHVSSLSTEIDVQSDSGLTHRYLVEAFVRHERLAILSRKVGDEANIFVEIYPQFDGELSEFFGVGIVRTWDATNIVTKVILSRAPLVSGTDGTLTQEDFVELDRIWEQGFKADDA
ncbi:hypothetical protein ABT121_25955 [Streptomyces sp. NPDC001928]|uniref:hypothetical protein n=1 Tax=Streptomyces sp. NPDC001928 TaxID=3154404 RepID=UPI00333493AF